MTGDGWGCGMDGSVDLRWSPGYVGSRPRLGSRLRGNDEDGGAGMTGMGGAEWWGSYVEFEGWAGVEVGEH